MASPDHLILSSEQSDRALRGGTDDAEPGTESGDGWDQVARLEFTRSDGCTEGGGDHHIGGAAVDGWLKDLGDRTGEARERRRGSWTLCAALRGLDRAFRSVAGIQSA